MDYDAFVNMVTPLLESAKASRTRPRQEGPDETQQASRSTQKGNTQPLENIPKGVDNEGNTGAAAPEQKRPQTASRPSRILSASGVARQLFNEGAEVTLISDRIYALLDPPPKQVRKVTLNMAARDLKTKGFVVGPVQIKLGSRIFSEEIYVAPIADDMLLGMDFIWRHGIDLRVRSLRLEMGREEIPMEFGVGPRHGRVARAYVQRRTIVPPNTAKKIIGVMDHTLGPCMFEPSPELPAMAARTLHEGGREIHMYVLNPTDRHVHLEGNRLLGEVHAVYAVGTPPSEKVAQVPNNDIPQEDTAGVLPEHLTDLYTRSSTQLTPEEQGGLKSLLIQFQGVFARNEFDLGDFTALEHQIDTGQSLPIKQKMRRTPLNFAAEEKAHLQRMEAAGVIEPSQSEWASPPVLVRKRDGGVRWCIDYRKHSGLSPATVSCWRRMRRILADEARPPTPPPTLGKWLRWWPRSAASPWWRSWPSPGLTPFACMANSTGKGHH